MSQEGTDQIPMSAMSKPLCRLQALPGRTAGKGLWARRLLPLLLCLGWLWGATPVAAQDEASPPATEATGPYRNLAENHNGAFHLTREEGTVYATFQTDRSPVQFLARDHPEVLFTVPEGFRPVLPVTWEVSAEPVLPDGTPHPDQTDRRVFRMRVDRQGQVRYVDDAGVDRVGHLRYHTMLAWPLAGSEPQVCARPRYVRKAILEAVQALEEATPLCSLVDWEHLARIRTLSLSLSNLPVAHLDILATPSVRQALLGLTNLATLQVSTPNPGLPPDLVAHTLPDPGLPAGFLAHTPRLERLEVDATNFLVLPTGLFRYTPLLKHLALGYVRNNLAGGSISNNVGLPADLLASVPHLESLTIANRLPAEELVPLLAHLPRLTHLDVGSYSTLPETLLAGVPRLTHLELFSSKPPETLLTPVPHLTHLLLYSPRDLPETFLEGVPRLTHLELRNIHDPDLPANLLAPVPHLESLHLESWHPAPWEEPIPVAEPGLVLRLSHVPRLTRLTVSASSPLPETFLPAMPRLTHLTLRVTGVDGTTALPEQLLAQVPALTHLTLKGASLALPDGFFAHAPHLTSLALNVDGTNPLPARLLDPMSQLTELRMDMGRTTILPADFLTQAPHLKTLHLGADKLEAFPADFLTQAPYLETLSLGVESLEAFPAGFLSHAPRLETLGLDVESLEAFPAGFLSHAPHLKTLRLSAVSGQPPPEGFLAHAPRLVELHLHVPRLQALPPGFLAHAPHLETLELDYAEYGLYRLTKLVTPLASLPEGFLSHAPRLRQLKLELGLVTAFPEDFLAHAPQLRHLSLDANGVSALPPDFLARHPGLETVRLLANGVAVLPRGFLDRSPNLQSLLLDLQQVESLPEGFLTHAPRLHEVELGVNRVATFPADFLAHAPHLELLNLRALNLTALPPDFLAHAPHIHTLGLAMPLLEPTLAPEHRLWDTLQAASLRVKVSQPDPVYFPVPDMDSFPCSPSDINVSVGDILEVWERAGDDPDRRLLRVAPLIDHEISVFWGFTCPYLIDARFTEPTLAVCAADREPDACVPARYHYLHPEPFPFRG